MRPAKVREQLSVQRDAALQRSGVSTTSTDQAFRPPTHTVSIPAFSSQDRALVSLTGVSDRCANATKHIHVAVGEKARSNVLEYRRSHAAAELSTLMSHIFPNGAPEARQGRVPKSVLVPSLAQLVDSMVEEREAQAAVIALRHSRTKASFEDHMASQMRWLIEELGIAKEANQILDERYRLLLAETAGKEEVAHKAEASKVDAEVARDDAFRILAEERSNAEQTRTTLVWELQNARQKLMTALEAQSRGLNAAAAVSEAPQLLGKPTSAAAPSTNGKTTPSASTDAAFEEKEKLLNQLCELRAELNASQNEAASLKGKVDILTSGTERLRQAVSTTRRNADAEVANVQDMLLQVRDAHERETAEIERQYTKAVQQAEMFEAAAGELQKQLEDVTSRMLAMQTTLMSGPSVQTLLFNSLIKSDDATKAQSEINRMTDAVSDFVKEFESANEANAASPELLVKQAQRRKLREAEAARAAAEAIARGEVDRDASQASPSTEAGGPSTRSTGTMTHAGPERHTAMQTDAADCAADFAEDVEVVADDRAGTTMDGRRRAHDDSSKAAQKPRRRGVAKADAAVQWEPCDGESSGATSVDDGQRTRSLEASTAGSTEADDTPLPSPRPESVDRQAAAVTVGAAPGQTEEPTQPREVAPVTDAPARRPARVLASKQTKPRSNSSGTGGGKIGRDKADPHLKSRQLPSLPASKSKTAAGSANVKPQRAEPSPPDHAQDGGHDTTPAVAQEPSRTVISTSGLSRDQLASMMKSSDDDAFLKDEIERLMAAKDRAAIAWQESNSRLVDTQRKLEHSDQRLHQLTADHDMLVTSEKELAEALAEEQRQTKVGKERVDMLNATVRRLEDEALVKDEQQASEAKALHKDIIQLRQENQRLSLSDARSKMRAKERLYAEGTERLLRCLLSMQSTAACPVCLEVFVNPIVLVPCGHVVCSRCFRGSNESRGLLVIGDSDTLVFGPNTCVAASAPKVHSATPQQSAVGESSMTVLAQPSISEPNRHLMQRLRTASVAGALSSPEKVEAVAYAAEQALAKPSKATAWYCEECASHSVVRTVPCHRVSELIESASYIQRNVQTIREGVINKCVVVDGDDAKPVALTDSSATSGNLKAAAGTDLEADVQSFLLDD